MKLHNRFLCMLLSGMLVTGTAYSAAPALAVRAAETAAETATEQTTQGADGAAEAGQADPAAGQADPAAAGQAAAADPAAAEPAGLPAGEGILHVGDGWPEGPEISADAAIVMEAKTGTILYGKNVRRHEFPASVTKLMTGLLSYEYLSLSEEVTFSETAVFGIDRMSSNIGIDIGEHMTVDQCLYGLMIANANEVAVGLAEKVGGTQENFVRMMNAKAASLGCVDTNFVNAHGLHDDNHYTSALDTALIAQAYFAIDELKPYTSTDLYHFAPTDGQPDDFWVYTDNQLINGEYAYDGSTLIGGKSGYTDKAGSTLVTCAELGDLRLICVVLNEKAPAQFKDTCDLLDFGFKNFKKISISENEHAYTLSGKGFLASGSDIFGDGTDPFAISAGRKAVVPNGVAFEDLTRTFTRSGTLSASAPQGDGSETGDAAAAGATGTAEAQTEAATGTAEAGQAGDAAADTAQAGDAASVVSTEAQTEAATGAADAAQAGDAAAAADASPAGDAAATADASQTGDAAATADASQTGDAAAATVPFTPVYDEHGNIVMGTLTYTYLGTTVGTAEVLFVDPAKQTGETDEAPSGSESPAGSRRTGLLGGLIDYFTGLVHKGSNGTVYVDLPSILLLIAIPAFLLIFVLCGVSYLLYLARSRRSGSRRRVTRREKSRSTAARAVRSSSRSKKSSKTSSKKSSRKRKASAETYDDGYDDGFDDGYDGSSDGSSYGDGYDDRYSGTYGDGYDDGYDNNYNTGDSYGEGYDDLSEYDDPYGDGLGKYDDEAYDREYGDVFDYNDEDYDDPYGDGLGKYDTDAYADDYDSSYTDEYGDSYADEYGDEYADGYSDSYDNAEDSGYSRSSGSKRSSRSVRKLYTGRK